MKLSGGGKTHCSFISSASSILRRRNHGFCAPAATTYDSLWSNSKSRRGSRAGPALNAIKRSMLRSINSRHSVPTSSSHETEYDPRIPSREPIDDRGRETCGEWVYGSDPDFTGGRIGKKLYFLDALPQLVESGEPVLEYSTAIERRLDALTAPFKQTHAERVFEIGNRLRHNRVRNRETLGSLRHAATLHGGEQHVHVAQLQPPSDAFVPLHGRFRS